ncbi:glycosyltransferase family 2 protein, partial [Planktotalea sp.]|uniref:glycosyltransferase family 2 protein n=1 Tax=Planktotalea sp. TaxID=2029877 RepID=UPI003296DEE0
ELGFENLFVVSHGADPKIAELCPKASVITIPRDTLEFFDRNRANLLNGIHAGLSNVYDWIIRTDADELICYDPDLYPDLPSAISANAEAPVLTALGFELFESNADTALTEQPTFSQRTNIAFSGHYSKAVAARRAIDFSLHGIRVAPRKLESYPFTMPKGFYLAHLKFANSDALHASNDVRMQVANSEGDGLPGAGWGKADEDTIKLCRTFWDKPEKTWHAAEEHAFDTLSIKPTRKPQNNLIKTRALKLNYRTTLPEKFARQG